MPDEDDKELYQGERGPAWRKYRRDMLSTARGKFSKNDKFSFKQAMLGTDEGGVDPAAPAMPVGAAALATAQQKRIVRHGEAYKFVYDSIGEERLKNMLDAIDDDHADGLAKAAWDLIIRECDDPGDELELTRLNILWTCASVMNTVGHSPSTIVDYHRELQTMNAQRPQASRYSMNEVAAKFLSSIVYPETLAAKAAEELRRDGNRRDYHLGAPNFDRDLISMVKAFDDIWRSLYLTIPISPREHVP